jgi:hypothetical protein
LTMLVQETLQRNPHNGHLFVFRSAQRIDQKACGTTARACAFSRNGWSEAVLSGHRPFPAMVWSGR